MKNKSKINKIKDSEQKVSESQMFWLWQFLSSVKLAVVVIFLIAVACILGTFIVQGRSPEEYAARYGRGWAAFLEGAQFTEVFHSYWFTILLVLLCLNLLVCAIKRWRNTVLQIGFLSTHMSLILIMSGSLIDSRFGSKGAINLVEGQSVDYFYTFEDQKRVPLGFELLLEDFELEKHKPKFELISYVKQTDKERRISTEIGTEQLIPSSPYKVTIKRLIPDAELVREPINTSKEEKNPAIFVQLFGSEHVDVEGWLIAKSRYWYEYKMEGIRIEYIWGKTQEALNEPASHKAKDDKTEEKKEGKVMVNLKDRNIEMEFPLKIGKHFHVADTEYHIQVSEYTPDFVNRDLPVEQQTADNPAIKVEIHGSQGDEIRWVFAKYPDWDEMHATKYSDLKLLFEAPDNVQLIRHLVKVAHDSEGNNRLIYLKDNEIIETTSWEFDKKYSIGNTGYQLKFLKYYPSFGLREEVIQRSEDLKNPAIYIEADGPAGKVSEWLFAKDARTWWHEDGNLALLYQEEGEMIKDFKSALKIIEGGKVVKTKTIEVNNPLSYKGIDFYQANYDPNNPKFSGIQITCHPGIPVVYVGFGLLCFGIVFIFYIKPFIKRSRDKKRKKEAYA